MGCYGGVSQPDSRAWSRVGGSLARFLYPARHESAVGASAPPLSVLAVVSSHGQNTRTTKFSGAASWGCGPQPELRLVPRRAVYARTPPVGDGPPISRDSHHTHNRGQHAAPATGVGPDPSRSATLRFCPVSAGRQGARATGRLRSRPHRKRQPTQRFRRRKKSSRPTQIASMVRLPKRRPIPGRPNRRVP